MEKADSRSISVSLDFCGPRREHLLVTPEWSIEKLRQAIRKKLKIGDNFYLVIAGHVLREPHKLIRDYRVLNNQTITIYPRFAFRPKTPLQHLDDYINLTCEPCCITFESDPEDVRAEMPCGCAIAADAMKSLCTTTLDKGDCTFHCPNCNDEWEFFLVRHVLKAVMTSDELESVHRRIDKNCVRSPQADISRCGQCGSYSVRDASKPVRVVCNVCTANNKGRKYEFCWLCGQQWKGSGRCGNANCGTVAERIKILRECGTKEIGGVAGCPDKRGCPKCGALIEHTRACKHMKCRCGCQFCFVCLKTQDSKGNWQCGSYMSPCPVAPRQTSLPM